MRILNPHRRRQPKLTKGPALLLAAATCILLPRLSEEGHGGEIRPTADAAPSDRAKRRDAGDDNAGKDVYRASAVLEIVSRQPYLVFQLDDEDDERFVKTQIELLTSSLVLERVATAKGIADSAELKSAADPVTWLRERISIERQKESDLYTVNFDCSDPELAARVANAIIDNYFKVYGDRDAQLKNQMISQLEQNKARRERAIKQMQQVIRDNMKGSAMKDPVGARILKSDDGERIVKIPIDQLQSDLTTTEIDRKVLEARLTRHRKQTAARNFDILEEAIELAVEDRIAEDELVAHHRTMVSRLREMETRITNAAENPEYQRLKQRLDELSKQVDDLQKKLREQVRRRKIAEILTGRKKAEDAMKTELADLKTRERLLRDRYFRQLTELANTTGQSVNTEFIRAELDREKEIYQAIAQRIAQIQTEKGAPPRVILRVEAKPPRVPLKKAAK